jgi:DNA-binding MarR family transcriptional regulator
MKNGPAKKIIFKLIQVNRLHRNILDHKLKEFKVHRSQHQLLRYLLDVNNLPSQKEIADNLDITAAAVATTIKKMEKEGLVKKTPSKQDNRINLINITPEGRKILSQTRQMFNLSDQDVIKGISKEELDIAFKVLSKMENNLIEMGAVDQAANLYKTKND